MPLTVVIGGQYGSEGKGKVALSVAQATRQLRSFELVAPIPGTPGQIATAEVSSSGSCRRVPR